jgi:hypothetical protein
MATRVPYSGRDLDAAADPGGPCRIRSIEIVQAVQDPANSVELIATKTTVVRVYVDVPDGAAAGVLSGEIAWRRGTGGETYASPVKPIRIDPTAHPDLAAQRRRVDASLNFILPPEAITAGQVSLRVARIFALGGAEYAPTGIAEAAANFSLAPPLRVRAIGLRYRVSGQGPRHTPDAVHFNYLRSYLLRAYPIAELQWSQQVVDADFGAPFGGSSADLANAQLAALRSREVSGGVDPRTHYYGLVSDRGGFLRGKAFDIPGDARPDTVAVGPVGVPNGFSGDLDQSYADWYGAHELGHTFGRYHPGFPAGTQDASDSNFPYPDGLLSGDDPSFVGFDVGDSNLALPMTVLSGHECHDVMTYADRQWLSAYTYTAVLERLRAEEQLVP